MAKHPKPGRNKSPAAPPSKCLVPLEAILSTEELNRRPERPPDYEGENSALAELVQSLGNSPRTILQTLAETMLRVFKTGSAGVSLLSINEKRFEWMAIAGAWKSHLGRGTSRDFGPCGDVLDCNAPLLFQHWERRYPYLREITPLAEEGLLVPFHVQGRAVGTIWAISHDDDRKFDAEDLRQLKSLGRFASAAYQAVNSMDVLDQRRAALNLMEDAVESRKAMEGLNKELRASEDRYRTLFNLGPVAVYSCDSSGVIQNFNSRAAELWGRSPQHGDTDKRFCGSHKLFRPDGRFMPHEGCPMAEVVSGRLSEVCDEEVVIERPDGSRITVVVNIRPLKNEHGGVTGAINCFYDITERKQAEMASASLAAIVESSDDAIISKDLNGVITSWNKGAVRLFGYTAEEAIGRSITMLIPADRQHEEPQILARLKSGQSVDHFETVRIRKDGSRLEISLTISPIKDAQGHVTGASKIARDITERKRVEQATYEAAQRFRFLAESMPQKIFTARPNGDVDYFNQQWMEYTGLTFEQIKDWGWKQFIHSEDLQENVRVWRHSIDTGEPFHCEHRCRRADGSYRWHLSHAVPMRDRDGNITMWIGSNTDIQSVREQEERLLKTEKLAATGQLAASMAHEINNPLSSVTNALYLLENQAKLDETARMFVNIAATELARVSRIVRQSLSYYRAGTAPHDVDLSAIVNDSLQIFSEKLTRQGIELKHKVADGARLVGFPDELRQVIDNLLLNALEAMPGAGRLSISLRESCDWTHDLRHRRGVRLTIADTGCGIPKGQVRARIFEPFFTTKPEKGTGLGLWILRGIISKHDGVMSLRSSDAKGKSGTVISIFLPSNAQGTRKSKPSEIESAA